MGWNLGLVESGREDSRTKCPSSRTPQVGPLHLLFAEQWRYLTGDQSQVRSGSEVDEGSFFVQVQTELAMSGPQCRAFSLQLQRTSSMSCTSHADNEIQDFTPSKPEPGMTLSKSMSSSHVSLINVLLKKSRDPGLGSIGSGC